MKRIIILGTLLLFLISACFLFFHDSVKDLYNKGLYEEVVLKTTKSLNKKITENDLYYNCAALSKLNKKTETREKAELYYYLFEKNKDHRISILRILLFTSEPALAYEAAQEMKNLVTFNKSDNIQYYKVLNDNELFTAASKHLSEISGTLSPGEVAFAVINGNAPTWQILSSLDNLYTKEGVSKDFVSAIKLALPIVVSRDGIDYIPILLKDTYDGSADYSIVLGDFYYAIGEDELAIKYWSNAAPIYPKEIAEREKLISR